MRVCRVKRLRILVYLVLAFVLYYQHYLWLLTRKRQAEIEKILELHFQNRISLGNPPKQKSQNFQVDGDQVVVDPGFQNVTNTVNKFKKKTKNGTNRKPTNPSLKQRIENWKANIKKKAHLKINRPKLQPGQIADTLKIRDSTAEPKWRIGDNYTLDTSSTQTSCKISVKIKAINSTWLKNIFLPQITIFMDNRHFSDKEWQRLEHFVPPFGWMTLNYTDIKEVVSALPHLLDQQILLSARKTEAPRCISCAVVGNGGILNGSRLGKEIDKHDYVFRVNGAVIKGYERDVGNRTSFYGFTSNTLLSSLHFLRNEGFRNIPTSAETKYILFTEGQRDFEWLEAVQKDKPIRKGSLKVYRKSPRYLFGSSFNLSNLLVAHPDFTRYLKDRYLRSKILNSKYWAIYRPSTGALVLLTALHLCDTVFDIVFVIIALLTISVIRRDSNGWRKVSAYGFMTEDYKNYSDHYYDKYKKETILYINHDFLLEKKLWRNLHQQNIMTLYQRT